MKKLLQINSVVNTGSTGRIAEEIGLLASSHGWKTFIAYGRHGNPSKSSLIKIGNKIDNFYHLLITRIFDRHGFGSRKATKSLIRKIDEINPDIIHLHNIHGYYLNIEILFEYLELKGIPVVWTLHDCWAFTGHCVHFEQIGCSKWKNSCSKCPLTKSYPKSLLFDNSKINYQKKRKLFNSSKKNITIVSVSYWLQNLVESSFLKKNKTKTIHNGIDLSIFNCKDDNQQFKDKLNLQNKFLILGVASVWDISKGFFDFIDLSKVISEDELIILVGLSKNQISILPNNIIGIEKTESTEQLAEFYSGSNVFVNLTYADTFPTTNLEALACGTPVITYNTGGSPEAISKETGYVVKQGDKAEVLKCIRKIKEVKKENFIIPCRERAETFFNKNQKYNEYLDLYNNLINDNIK
ncbi:glycosyltransferase [Maribacter luteus]|uniref:glycosyltransferase n=1 Tax=Maribacter luteus TaxID=2594478 RepID=UPI0024912BE3|nr:glycosyltransferase [Maribacter luteus]